MLVRGYFDNYLTRDEEQVFLLDIDASKDSINNCMGIASCLYQGYTDDYIEDYDLPTSKDEFLEAYESEDLWSESPYMDYLAFVLDSFGINWSWHNQDVDMEICLN